MNNGSSSSNRVRKPEGHASLEYSARTLKTLERYARTGEAFLSNSTKLFLVAIERTDTLYRASTSHP